KAARDAAARVARRAGRAAVHRRPDRPSAGAAARHPRRQRGRARRGAQAPGAPMTVAVLIVAEHDGTRLNPSTAKCVTCATRLAPERIDVAVLGAGAAAVAEAAAALADVSRVLHVDRPYNREPLAAVLAPQIVELARGYTHVLAPSTQFAQDVPH